MPSVVAFRKERELGRIGFNTFGLAKPLGVSLREVPLRGRYDFSRLDTREGQFGRHATLARMTGPSNADLLLKRASDFLDVRQCSSRPQGAKDVFIAEGLCQPNVGS
jgi:hypothetical protein